MGGSPDGLTRFEWMTGLITVEGMGDVSRGLRASGDLGITAYSLLPGRSTTTHGRNIDRTEWNTEPTEPIFGRTDLRKGVSEAKFDAEADFDVKKCLAPPKSAENREKRKKKTKIFPEKISASKNRKLQIVRNAFSRSFAAIGAKFEGERNFDAVQNQT